MTESWKDYRINYYMEAFRRLGMFEKKNSEGEADSELYQDAFSELCYEAIAALKAGFKHNGRAANAELNSFGEKSENFSTSSPFWNSDEIESLHPSENIRDTLRPRSLGNHIWNWSAFFLGPFWGIARGGIIFVFDLLLLFPIFFIPAYVAITAKVGDISFVTRLFMILWFFIYAVLHGYFGNYVYQLIVKREVEEGIHVVERYFSFLPNMDAHKRDVYSEKIKKRVRKKYPQKLIVNEENVRDYLKVCPRSDVDTFVQWVGGILIFFICLFLK